MPDDDAAPTGVSAGGAASCEDADLDAAVIAVLAGARCGGCGRYAATAQDTERARSERGWLCWGCRADADHASTVELVADHQAWIVPMERIRGAGGEDVAAA